MAKVYGFNESKDRVEVLSKAATTAEFNNINNMLGQSSAEISEMSNVVHLIKGDTTDILDYINESLKRAISDLINNMVLFHQEETEDIKKIDDYINESLKPAISALTQNMITLNQGLDTKLNKIMEKLGITE